jgi:WD40 repeat protein
MRHLICIVLLILLPVISTHFAGADGSLPTITVHNAALVQPIGIVDSGAADGYALWSPDGRTLAISTPQEIHLYNPATPNAAPLRLPVITTPSQFPVFDAPRFGFMPDGATLYAFDWGNADSVQLWDVATATLRARLLVGDVHTFNVVVAQHHLALYAPYAPGPVQVWDTATANGDVSFDTALLLDVDEDASVTNIQISANGRWLALETLDSSRGSTVHLWDINTGNVAATIEREYAAREMRFSPSNDALLTVDDFTGTSVFTLPTLTLRLSVPTTYYMDATIPLSPDGSLLVAVDQANAVLRLVDMRSGDEQVTLERADNTSNDSFVFSVDSRLFAYAANFADRGAGYVHIWNMTAGEQALAIPVAPTSPESPFSAAQVQPFAFTPDGSVLLVAAYPYGDDPYRLHLYDTRTGARLWETIPHIPEGLPVSAVRLNGEGSAFTLSYGGSFCCAAQFGTRVIEWWGVPSG